MMYTTGVPVVGVRRFFWLFTVIVMCCEKERGNSEFVNDNDGELVVSEEGMLVADDDSELIAQGEDIAQCTECPELSPCPEESLTINEIYYGIEIDHTADIDVY